MKKQIFRVIAAILVFAVVLAAFWVGGMIMGGSKSDTAAFDRTPNYLVILGCRLYGEEPSVCLTERIDAAAEYLKEHPLCMAVASGAQGEDEAISEAEAISRALQEKGIPKKQILKEEQSTSTYENFLFTKQLLDEREGEKPYFIAFVTNDFHVYRARKMAEYVGFQTPIAVSAVSSATVFYPHFLREIAAVAAYWYQFR